MCQSIFFSYFLHSSEHSPSISSPSYHPSNIIFCWRSSFIVIWSAFVTSTHRTISSFLHNLNANVPIICCTAYTNSFIQQQQVSSTSKSLTSSNSLFVGVGPTSGLKMLSWMQNVASVFIHQQFSYLIATDALRQLDSNAQIYTIISIIHRYISLRSFILLLLLHSHLFFTRYNFKELSNPSTLL